MDIANFNNRCTERVNFTLVVPFFVLLSVLLVRILAHPDFCTADTAMYLSGAQLILQGKTLYVDFVDILPPLIFYLSIIPLCFANLAHIPIPLAVMLSTWILIALCLFTSIAVLWRHATAAEWKVLLPVLFGFFMLALALFFHFGQKEQIFVLIYLSFFLIRWLRTENRQPNTILATLIGVATGIAACLKPPQFLTFIIILECYWCTRASKAKVLVSRLMDPEVISCATTAAGALILFLYCAPHAMTHNFFFRWLPLTLSGYGAYFCSPVELLLFTNSLGCLFAGYWSIILVCLIALLLRNQSSLFIPLLIWTIAGWLIYIIQQKGWAYHTIPMMSGYFMLASLELAVLAKRLMASRLFAYVKHRFGKNVVGFMIYAIMLCVCLPWLVRDSITTGYTPGVAHYLKEAVLKYTQPGDPVLIISTYNTPAYPALIQTNRTIATRYLWTYPFFVSFVE